jgi:DNA invertase Pin-like site-specific DNA recombinase
LAALGARAAGRDTPHPLGDEAQAPPVAAACKQMHAERNVQATNTGERIRVAIYTRVSTGSQTTENQLRELEAVAERHGWQVVATFTDEGISGAKGRDQRPGLNSLLEGVTRRDFDKVMAWSVDRLGRSLPDLLAVMGELKAKGVDFYLHQQSLDTSTPAGKAMFQMLGVFSEFEREIIRERVNSGLARAKAQGKKLGRPRRDTALQSV